MAFCLDIKELNGSGGAPLAHWHYQQQEHQLHPPWSCSEIAWPQSRPWPCPSQQPPPGRQQARLHKPGSESSRPGGQRCLWGPETTGQQTSPTPCCTSSVLCHRASHLMGSEQNQSDNINHVVGKIIRGAIKHWASPFPHPPTYST